MLSAHFLGGFGRGVVVGTRVLVLDGVEIILRLTFLAWATTWLGKAIFQ